MKTKVFLIPFLFFTLQNIIAQQLAPSQVYANVSPSIVQITSYNQDSSINSFGSGVAIGDSGYIYTNWHVIEESFFFTIKSDRLILSDVLVAGIDPDRDIAILKIRPGLIRGVSIGNSDSVKTGDIVYALGNPMGYTNTFSEGIVSSLRDGYHMRIQYTASISHGSSGGALLNSRGGLIGITSNLVPDGQSLNFAVPINSFLNTFTANLYDTVGIMLMNSSLEFFKEQSDKSPLYIDSLVNLYIEKYPLTTESAYFFTQLFIKTGNYQRAMVFIDCAIWQKPCNAELRVLKARIFEFQNSFDDAIAAYGAALAIDSLNFDALYGRAKTLKFKKTDHLGAIRDFLAFVNAYPGEEYFYLDIADSYLQLGDTANALRSISNSYFAKIEDTPNLTFRASILCSMGKYSEAIFDYDYAIIKNPGIRSVYFKRGIAFLKLGMPEDAASDFQKCISLSARDASSYCNLAYCYFNLLDFELAEANFEKAIKLEPKGFDAYVGLSITAFEQKKIKKCLQTMSKAIELRPVLKKGMKGIAKITEDGYFWQSQEMKGIKNVFVLMNMEEPEPRDLSDDDPRNATGRQIQIAK